VQSTINNHHNGTPRKRIADTCTMAQANFQPKYVIRSHQAKYSRMES